MPEISWEIESENDDIKTTILDSNSVKIRYLGDRNVNYTCKGKACQYANFAISTTCLQKTGSQTGFLILSHKSLSDFLELFFLNRRAE